MRSMVAKALAMSTINRNDRGDSSFPKIMIMFNLRNLFCLSAIVLLMSASPSIALSSHCNTQVNIVQSFSGGIVDIIQLQTDIRVEMRGQGYIHLSLSDSHGRSLYSTTVNALERNHLIDTRDLPSGQYRLRMYNYPAISFFIPSIPQFFLPAKAYRLWDWFPIRVARGSNFCHISGYNRHVKVF